MVGGVPGAADRLVRVGCKPVRRAPEARARAVFRSKAFELKQELGRLGGFKDYQDRFLDLFKKAKQGRHSPQLGGLFPAP